MTIHKIIKQLREKKGLSQERLATLSGLDISFISMIERGKRTPSLQSIEKIAFALDIQSWEIVKFIEED